MNTRLRRIAIGLGLAALLGVAAEFKYYVVPKRFRVVEPGQIQRGGWQTPHVLARLLATHRIATVLNVACDPNEPDARGEGEVVRSAGVGWRKILMPGTGLGTFEQLDEAADFLAEPAHRPVFVHCAAGVHRTNMAIAAFRIKHCRWSIEAALAEMRRFGFDPTEDWEQANHLRAYANRIDTDSPGSARVRGVATN